MSAIRDLSTYGLAPVVVGHLAAAGFHTKADLAAAGRAAVQSAVSRTIADAGPETERLWTRLRLSGGREDVHAAPRLTGAESFDLETRRVPISTGCPNLDAILGGGLACGSLTGASTRDTPFLRRWGGGEAGRG